MTKTHIIETTEKYDKDGKLVEKIVREETNEDNTEYPKYPTHPYSPVTYKLGEPSCDGLPKPLTVTFPSVVPCVNSYANCPAKSKAVVI